MKATTERLFELLSIKTGDDGVIQYHYGEEDSRYHGVGQINGEDHGVDPSKKEVYSTIGAQELLLQEKTNLAIIWDPDGDRINIVTAAPSDIKEKAVNYGLSVDEKFTENDKSIVYFTPNQIYFMLTAFRLSALKESNEISEYDWFSVRSVASTRSIDELLSYEKIPIVDVCVGFKHLGTLSSWIENSLGEKKTYPKYVSTGKDVLFGDKPRALIMYEESGGANFGGTEMLKNKSGSKSMITMREKDGMQVGLFVLALAAFLHNKNISFAEYYIQTIDKYNIKYKYNKREDYKLYEETLTGAELEKAKEEGMKKKNNIMEFFSKLIEESKNRKPIPEINNILCEALSTKLSSELLGIYDAGADKTLRGVLLKFKTFWFLIRESGTEVVLRYYIEGENNDEIQVVMDLLKKLDSKIG
jgi:phosphomannomutase